MRSFNRLNRRDILIGAAAAASGVALAPGAADAKVAQAAVKYQQDPKDGKECDGCNFFVEPNSCKMVDGEINPKGWCALWTKKAG
jgi:hypothetical protein